MMEMKSNNEELLLAILIALLNLFADFFTGPVSR
jgi:hypothetical protein